jgi:hypothetical protein
MERVWPVRLVDIIQDLRKLTSSGLKNNKCIGYMEKA